jgi:hypothetical protein
MSKQRIILTLTVLASPLIAWAVPVTGMIAWNHNETLLLDA